MSDRTTPVISREEVMSCPVEAIRVVNVERDPEKPVKEETLKDDVFIAMAYEVERVEMKRLIFALVGKPAKFAVDTRPNKLGVDTRPDKLAEVIKFARLAVETRPSKVAVDTRPFMLETLIDVPMITPAFTWMVLSDVAMISPVTRYPALDPILSESTVRDET